MDDLKPMFSIMVVVAVSISRVIVQPKPRTVAYQFISLLNWTRHNFVFLYKLVGNTLYAFSSLSESKSLILDSPRQMRCVSRFSTLAGNCIPFAAVGLTLLEGFRNVPFFSKESLSQTVIAVSRTIHNCVFFVQVGGKYVVRILLPFGVISRPRCMWAAA